MRTENYDVIILGSGIAGTILGTILASNKISTVLVDKDSHPKFAIGESTIPQTSAMLKVLAERYNVPEFYNLSSFQNIITNVSRNCGMKRNFGFVYHDTNVDYLPERCHQLGALRDGDFKTATEAPTETHLFRQDIDAYLMFLAIKYGCKIYQNTQINNLNIDNHSVSLETNKNILIKAKYIVDGTGFSSYLAKFYDLRVSAKDLKTCSRTLYTHMIDVKPFDQCIPLKDNPQRPAKWSQGTLHHVFNGGWLWIIPFDNHQRATNQLCSVGLQLDTRQFPKPSIPAEEEFFNFIKQYPTIAQQFEQAKSVRDWIGTDRIQYSAKTSIGNRYCLLSHAMGFIDPLYSRGLSNTLETISLLSGILIDAVRENNFDTEKFQIVDTLQQGLIKWNDDLVNASYISFRDYDLWNAWFRVWGLIQPLGMFRVDHAYRKYKNSGDVNYLKSLDNPVVPGALTPDHYEYMQFFEKAVSIAEDVEKNILTTDVAAKKIFSLLEGADFLPPHYPYTNPAMTFGSESLIHRFKKHRWFVKHSNKLSNDKITV